MRALLLLSFAALPWIPDCGKKFGSEIGTVTTTATVAEPPVPPPAIENKPDLKGEPPILIKDEKAKRLGDDEDQDVNR